MHFIGCFNLSKEFLNRIYLINIYQFLHQNQYAKKQK